MSIRREVISQSQIDYFRANPHIFLGAVQPSRLFWYSISNGVLSSKHVVFPQAIHRAFEEVLDNATDELRRCAAENPYEPKRIMIDVDSSSKSVRISDDGYGFLSPSEEMEDGMTQIEAAFSKIATGTNFEKGEDEVMTGMHGLGVAIVNIYSDTFEVVSTNREGIKYYGKWLDGEVSTSAFAKAENENGTTILFQPSMAVFQDTWFVKEVLMASVYLKVYSLLKVAPNASVILMYDGVVYDMVNEEFFGDLYFEDALTDGKRVNARFYFDQHGYDALVVNGSVCQGFGGPVDAIKEIVARRFRDEEDKEIFKSYINVFMDVDLPHHLVRFAEQSKIRFAMSSQYVIEPIQNYLKGKLNSFYETESFSKIRALVESIKRERQKHKLRELTNGVGSLSTRYFPASYTDDKLMIVEGESALGSILSARNHEDTGVFSLVGKIKHTSTIKEITDNKELVAMLAVLGIDPTNPGSQNMSYKRIVIAVDPDPDGYHLAGLIIVFFYRWFPWVLHEDRLFVLDVPILAKKSGSETKYYYDKKDQEAGMRYIKGLGSLSVGDWKHILTEDNLKGVDIDGKTRVAVDYCFGKSAGKRKAWLAMEDGML